MTLRKINLEAGGGGQPLFLLASYIDVVPKQTFCFLITVHTGIDFECMRAVCIMTAEVSSGEYNYKVAHRSM